MVNKLNEAAMKAVTLPVPIKAMQENGFTVVGGTPQQMDKMVQDEVHRCGSVVESTGLRI